MCRDQQSDIRVALDNIDDQNKRFEMNRVTQLRSFSQEVLGSLNRLSKEQQLSKVSIEDHFKSLHALETFPIEGGSNQRGTEIRYKQPIRDTDIENLSSKMNELATAMKNLSREGKAATSEQVMLQRLSFPEMKTRYDNVKDAHSDTFSWIFKDDRQEDRPMIHYTEWLKHQEGIYWISGKPGSGKSTLVKFLCHHKETIRLLRLWAGNKRLVAAKFFFWNAGSKLQRSQEGLLRSLLFEVFRQAPELMQKVREQNSQLISFSRGTDPWTCAELLQYFQTVKNVSENAKARFCFFIDGLDEYSVADGWNYRELAQVLKEIADCSDIKLCVSSRPENDFVDAFGQVPDRYLKLEDLTKDDIRNYVNQCFLNSSQFQVYQVHDPGYDRLIEQIVEEAKGVFLWVYLAVNSILQGLTNADKLEELEKRLRHVPKTLEEYFQQMLDSVESIYRVSTSRQIRIALEARRRLSLLDWWFLDGETMDFVFRGKSEISSLENTDFHYILNTTQRRLQARCKGLLTVYCPHSKPLSELEVGDHCFVDFLHRTVRDYLLQPNMQDTFRALLPPTFDPKIELCRGFLAMLKDSAKVQFVYWEPEHWVHQMMAYASRIEDDSGDCPEALRDILDGAENAFILPNAFILSSPKYRSTSSFLAIAVERNAYFYLKYRLSVDSSLVHDEEAPLLATALSLILRDFWTFSRTRLEMISLLFDHGANVNEKVDRKGPGSPERVTIWCNFLRDMRDASATHLFYNTMMIYDTLQILIINGADPDEDIHVETEYEAARKETGRAADLHKREERVPIYETARSIIRLHLSEEQTIRLVGRANRKPHRADSRLSKSHATSKLSRASKLTSWMTKKSKASQS